MKVMGKSGLGKQKKLEKKRHQMLAGRIRPEMQPHMRPEKKPRH